MNVPAAMRRDQLKVNVARLQTLTTNLGPRYVVCQSAGGAHRGDRERRRGVAPHRGRRQADRASPEINSKIIADQFQSVLDGAGLDRPQGPDPADAGGAGLSDQQSHPHPRHASTTSCSPRRSTGIRRTPSLHVSSRIPATSIRSGSIRIDFPSAYGVYMHDTPVKNLFGEDFRFHSSGCVRVQNVRELVNWLLDETKGWSAGGDRSA